MASIVRFDRISVVGVRRCSADTRCANTRCLRSRAAGWIGALASVIVLCFTIGLADAEAAEVCEGSISLDGFDFTDLSDANLEEIGESLASQIVCSDREGSVRDLVSEYQGQGYTGLYDSISVDHEQVAQIARSYGVEIPPGFLESFEFVVLFGSSSDIGESEFRFVVIFTSTEAPVVTLSSTSLSIEEGGSETYTVRLSSNPDGTVTVTPSGGPEIEISPPKLTFDSSNWATPQTFTVTAEADNDTVNDRVTISHSVIGIAAAADDVAVTVTERPTEPIDSTEPMGVALTLVRHAARLQGNATTLSGTMTF